MRNPSVLRDIAVLAVLPLVATVLTAMPAAAAEPTPREAVAVGSGGGVATVDPDATRAGIAMLEAGGTAADAAVAAAAALGVTEPYSAGIGGGGFFVHYDAKSGKVSSLDGRETAPAAMKANSFVDPATGKELPFDRAVTSGLSVGVPGSPATWEAALAKWGNKNLDEALAPAAKLARDGFVVDAEFRGQTALNEKRFRAFPDTAALFLPGGNLPEVGSTFRNPALADTYAELGRQGMKWLYDGELAGEIANTAAKPPVDPAAGLPVAPGLMTAADLAAYEVAERKPTHVDYRGVDVYSMAPPSSGGTTVGEALGILENFAFSGADPVQALHLYLEASRLAYADRNKFLGDPAFVDVPVDVLLSDDFAADRACKIDPKKAATSPVPAGDLGATGRCATAPAAAPSTEGPSTTHLVAADRWGNVVSYTLTIEQTGGSGITVPGRGFLLNNELTDFDYAPPAAGSPLPANAPAGGKRPRSSMAPTIVLQDGKPLLAVGSPGGATIITTVLQTLINRLDLGMSLPDAVAAPRLSQRNSAAGTEAEPAFLAGPTKAALEAYGQKFVPVNTTFAPNPEIGAVAALEFGADDKVTYAAEPKRRGGGSAMAADD